MVSGSSIFFMIITIILSIIVPIALIVFLRKKHNISLKYVIVGAIAFLVAVKLLEGSIHQYVLYNNEKTATFLRQPIAYMLYGGLMAGIFEETARFICFKWILKKDRSFENGIAYGLGHGGIEAFLIAGSMYINNLITAIQINTGNFENLLDKVDNSTAQTLMYIKEQMIQMPSYTWIIAGIERSSSLIIQLGLSLLVLYAVREGKIRYFFLAILCHAVINFPVALYQVNAIENIIFLEEYLVIIAIVILFIIIKTRKKFKEKI
ncbi:YhfC family intramembrane metalloprotease [Clostridium sp. ATCC 25772]|uniref:YhfC family intramembrane metalloprotease n=1 Tax=Clostridium sp. ATCC 25772 TaxID=1676991 RepID=UPI000785006E|nr:YhfC family intramembrane metalloprotease [Clostridium sp. ATCC 25772]